MKKNNVNETTCNERRARVFDLLPIIKRMNKGSKFHRDIKEWEGAVEKANKKSDSE